MILDNTNILNSPVRRLAAKVELYSGSTLVADYTPYDALKEFEIERVGEENKFFGFGICQKQKIKLIDKDRLINITTDNSFKNYLSSGGSLINSFPRFYVTEVNRAENTNELSITAYDKLYNKFAGAHTVSELQLKAYTVREFAEACAELLNLNGIEIIGVGENESCFTDYYGAGANFEGTESIRDALNRVAEVTQTIYYINSNETLVFKRLDINGAAVLTIGKEDYIKLDSSTNRRLTAINHITDLGDNVGAALPQTGSTQYIKNNPFWELREDIDILVNNALAAVGGLTINQFECNWRGNFKLEIGDKIELITKDNEVVNSYLLDDTIEYNGGLTQKSQWKYTASDEGTFINSSSLGEMIKETYARVDKANKQIDIVASETSANSEAISQLQVNTSSITTTVSSLQDTVAGNNEAITALNSKVEAQITAEDVKLEIAKELENGVDKVITKTGFTFNENGLAVNKANSEMKTTITEDGMQVYKNNNTVLTANNMGVDALNLTATTYLIIGNNSRFEDYGSNRTGCFWIGGQS